MKSLTYLGHSCFCLEAENGWRVVFDPYQNGSVPGLELPALSADAVLCSHGHADHNASDLIQIEPVHTSPYTITTMETDHDDQGGSLRGKSNVTILSNAEEKIIHLGDLGRDLTDEEAAQLLDADLLMIPCGGFYTIDAAQAGAIIKQLHPELAVLMHYRTDEHGYEVIEHLSAIIEVLPETRILETSVLEGNKEQGIVALTADRSVIHS